MTANRFFWALLIAQIFLPISASSQVPNGGSPMVPNGALSFNPPVVINVSQYGAACDSVTNDDTAINNAISALRTLTQGASNNVNGVLSFNNGTRCLVNSLNFTGFTKGQIIIEGNGKAVYGRQSGLPVVDALGSIGLTFRDFTVLCSSDQACTYGMQWGRINTTSLDNGGSGMIFDNVQVITSATKAACYNFSGEGDFLPGLRCQNQDTTAASFGLIMDGCNHLNITSAFVTENAPIDTCQSFNQNTILNGHIYGGNANGGGALELIGITDHFYKDTYLNTGSSSCITLFAETATGSSLGTIDNGHLGIHCEGTNSPTDLMVVGGGLASPVINGLYLSDPGPQPSNSIFKLGGSATSATIQNLDLSIPSSFSSVSGTLRAFDAPQSWTVTGNAYFGNASFWNEPASWQGCVTLAANKWCYPDRPGPLDFKSGASVAYSSARRLGRSWSGPIANIRNTTSSAVSDIYLSGADSGDITGQAVFIAGTTGADVKLYDQSGNANDLNQATTASQPAVTLQLAALGNRTMSTYTGGGAMAMPSTSAVTYPFTSGGYVSTVVNQASTPTANFRVLNGGNFSIFLSTARQYNVLQAAATTNGTWFTGAIANAAHIIDLQYSAANNANVPTIGVDGASQSLTSAQPVGAITTTNATYIVGNNVATAGTSAWAGAIPELISWPSLPNTNTLDAIRRNQAAYYGLPSVP